MQAVEFPEAVGASSANNTAGVAGHCKKKGLPIWSLTQKVVCQKSPLYKAFRQFQRSQDNKAARMLDRARRGLDKRQTRL